MTSQIKLTPDFTKAEQKYIKAEEKRIEASGKSKQAEHLMESEIKNLPVVCPNCGHETKIGDIEVIIEYYDGYEPGPYEDWKYRERHMWVCEKCTGVHLTPQKERPFGLHRSFNTFVKKVHNWYNEKYCNNISGRVKELLDPYFKREAEQRDRRLEQIKIDQAKRVLEKAGIIKKELTDVE